LGGGRTLVHAALGEVIIFCVEVGAFRTLNVGNSLSNTRVVVKSLREARGLEAGRAGLLGVAWFMPPRWFSKPLIVLN
jgi:hypothetical protein